MLNEIEFSEEFAKRLIKKVEGLKIDSINGLEIKTEFENSNEYKHFLDNCYWRFAWTETINTTIFCNLAEFFFYFSADCSGWNRDINTAL